MNEQRFVSQAGVIYRVIGHLGTAGGFGSVVRVADEEGHEYALKTLHFGVPAEVLAAARPAVVVRHWRRDVDGMRILGCRHASER